MSSAQITHTRLTALFPRLPGWASTRKVKSIWILLKHETVSGNGISWDICKSAPRSRQITTPAPHHSVFTGRVPFLPPNQQRQSTKGKPQHKSVLCKQAYKLHCLSLSETERGYLQWNLDGVKLCAMVTCRFSSFPFNVSLHCFDTVGWASGKAPGL